ncbi:MAG: hypothetical protein ACRC6U_09615 [Fusobacteriaceae bacterium]
MEKKLQSIYDKVGELLEEQKKSNRESLQDKNIFESEPLKFEGHILENKDEYIKECYLTFLGLLFTEKITKDKLKKFRLIVNSVTEFSSDYFIIKARELDSKRLKEILTTLNSNLLKQNLLLDLLIISSITDEAEQLSKMVQVLKIEKYLLSEICILARNIIEGNIEDLIKDSNKEIIHFYCNLFFDGVYYSKNLKNIDLGHRNKKIVLYSMLKNTSIDGANSHLSIKKCIIDGKIEGHPSISIDVEESSFKIRFINVEEIEKLGSIINNDTETILSGFFVQNKILRKQQIVNKIKTKKFEKYLKDKKVEIIKNFFLSEKIKNFRIDEESKLSIEFGGHLVTV